MHVTISGFRLWFIVMQADIINLIKISVSQDTKANYIFGNYKK